MVSIDLDDDDTYSNSNSSSNTAILHAVAHSHMHSHMHMVAVVREVFLHLVRMHYHQQVEDGRLEGRGGTARALLASADLALHDAREGTERAAEQAQAVQAAQAA